MAKEIRVTVTDKEEELYNYIISKSSKTAFLKDLASVEKKREENYINSYVENQIDQIISKLIDNIDITENTNNTNSTDKKNEGLEDKNKNSNVEYDFDIDDLGLDD